MDPSFRYNGFFFSIFFDFFEEKQSKKTKVDQYSPGFYQNNQGSRFTLLFVPLLLFMYIYTHSLLFPVQELRAFILFFSPPFFSSSTSISFLMETTELKVEMVDIHEKRLRKCLSKLRGIEKVEVDGNSQKVAVTGYAHRNKILKAVRRAGLKADFWSAQNELLNAYASSSFQNMRFNNFNFF